MNETAERRWSTIALRASVCTLASTLMLAAAWPSAAASVGSAEKPAWTKGDFWLYSATETIDGGTFTYSDRVEVTGSGEVVAGNQTWPVYNTTSTFTVESPIRSDSFVVHTWYRTSDLALVRFEAFDGGLASSHDPPIHMEWPLLEGRWDGVSTEVRFGDGRPIYEWTISYRFHVTDGGVRITPAGSFETLRVDRQMTNLNGTSSEVTYYSPLVGNTVVEERVGDDLLLSSYRFRNAPSPVPLAVAIIAIATAVAIAAVIRSLRPRRPREGPVFESESDAANARAVPDPQTFKTPPRMPPP